MEDLLFQFFSEAAAAWVDCADGLEEVRNAFEELESLQGMPDGFQEEIRQFLEDTCEISKHFHEALTNNEAGFPERFRQLQTLVNQGFERLDFDIDELKHGERRLLERIGIRPASVQEFLDEFDEIVEDADRLAKVDFSEITQATSRASRHFCKLEEIAEKVYAPASTFKRAAKIARCMAGISADSAAAFLDFGLLSGTSIVSGAFAINEELELVDVPDEFNPNFWVGRTAAEGVGLGREAMRAFSDKWRFWRRR